MMLSLFRQRTIQSIKVVHYYHLFFLGKKRVMSLSVVQSGMLSLSDQIFIQILRFQTTSFTICIVLSMMVAYFMDMTFTYMLLE